MKAKLTLKTVPLSKLAKHAGGEGEILIEESGDGCWKECYKAVYILFGFVGCRWKCVTHCPTDYYIWLGASC